MYARAAGRFEITHVPALIRERDRQITGRNRRELAPVLKRYERVCFTKEAVRPLDELNQFVSQVPDGEFFDAKSGIGSRMDMDNVIDFHLLVLFTSNMDGSDKNFLLARDALTADAPQPRFFFVPWDYDATFGRNYEGSLVEPTAWLSNHLFDRLLGNAAYQQRYTARWLKLRKGQFSVENIARMIDDNARTLGDAAKRNERRWKEIAGLDSDQLTFTEELN